MLTARQIFDSSIKDATELLDHFNAIPIKPPPDNAEVLKRASLIMACTAWETYVEDRARETVLKRLGEGNESFQNQFVLRHLELALKQFHNPTAEKTRKLFADFLGIEDVTLGWVWNHYDRKRARDDLDELLKKRGDAVHRSKAPSNGIKNPDLINKDQLKKAINFLKCLVEATDSATDLSKGAAPG